MRESTTVNKPALWLSWLAALILILLPFHAFLTVWLASAAGHYTLLRLWKEGLLLILIGGCSYLLAKDAALRQELFSSRISQLIGVYAAISLIWGWTAYALDKVTLKAVAYGLLVNLRFLIFFLTIWIIATKSPLLRQIWPKLILIPAAIVIVIGLVQRILPYDVLRHFGYGRETIFPYQSINHNIHYPRIMSTLRGANPLGAYLVLILSLSAILWGKVRETRLILGALAMGGFLALVLSFSRAAWIGAAASGLLLAGVLLRKQAKRIILIGLVILLAFGAGFTLALHNNQAFENAFLHTDSRSKAKDSSNQEHLSNFRNGLNDVAREPLGRGIGTAGPASVYNDNKGRIAENYFIQIGQELGWLGMALFIGINVLLAKALWLRRGDNLALGLLISLIGLTVINLVSHAWTDDTIAYIFWGLAGVALAKPAATR